jgi:hypothetical protein
MADEVGRLFAEALGRKAEAGLDVRVISCSEKPDGS